MLASNIFWHSTEHSEGESLLNELMAINTWGNRIKEFLINVGFLGEFFDSSLILVSDLNNIFITESSNVISLDNCGENWEPVLDVSSIIEFIDENTGYFDLISWSCSVYKIIEDDDLFLSWNTTWWDRSWSFLDGPFLIVSVDTFALFNLVLFATALADDTFSEVLLFFAIVFVDWALKIIALHASVILFFELGEYLSPFGDYTSDFDQGVQMNLSEVSKLVLDGKILNSNVDLIMNLVVVGVDLSYNFRGYLIDNIKHQFWLFC